MSKKRRKKAAAEAKASAAASNEEKTDAKEAEQTNFDAEPTSNGNVNANGTSDKKSQSGEEWLAEEMENINVEDVEDIDADELMKQAAKQLETARADAKEWKDNYLRLHAEWDTYRRRLNEQRAQEKAVAAEGLVTDILPVLDDFERTIEYGKNNDGADLLSGVEAVYAKLQDALVKHGVEMIDPKDYEAFDALEHQAVATVAKEDVPDESVAMVLQKGYKMGKKVIRPAMVSVTTGGPARPKEEDSEKEETE